MPPRTSGAPSSSTGDCSRSPTLPSDKWTCRRFCWTSRSPQRPRLARPVRPAARCPVRRSRRPHARSRRTTSSTATIACHALPIDAVAREMGIQPSSVISVRRGVTTSAELDSTSSTDAFAHLPRTSQSPSCWRCSTRGAIRFSLRGIANDCSTLSDRPVAHIVHARCTLAHKVILTSYAAPRARGQHRRI